MKPTRQGGRVGKTNESMTQKTPTSYLTHSPLSLSVPRLKTTLFSL